MQAGACVLELARLVPRRRHRHALTTTAGVRGITSFITAQHSEAGVLVTLADLPRGLDGLVRITVDGNSLAFWLLGERLVSSSSSIEPAAWHLGGEYREQASRTRTFVAAMKEARVVVSVIFDPAPLTAPESGRKTETRRSRLAGSSLAVGQVHQLVNGGSPETLSLQRTPPPELFLETVKRTLREEGVEVLVSCRAEADDELLASVRSRGAFAVLSNDSDFAVAEGSRLLHLDSLLLEAEGPAVGWKRYDARGWLYEPATVCAALRLPSPAALFAACCLLGQDVTGELTNRLQILSRLGFSSDARTRPVDLAAWLVQKHPGLGTADAEAACAALLEVQVPAECEMSEEDALTWRTAVDASHAFYCRSAAPPAPPSVRGLLRNVLGRGVQAMRGLLRLPPPPAVGLEPPEWLLGESASVRAIAAAQSRGEVPAWSLSVAAHAQSAQGVTYERPWGPDEAGGIAAAHRPLRARLYSLLGASGPVTETTWDGLFWGSGGMDVEVALDSRGARQALEAAAADVKALSRKAQPSTLWLLRMRALLHPSSLPLPSASDDPALALPLNQAFAALCLRYLFSLRLGSRAVVVQRLTAWQAAAAVAATADALSSAVAAAFRKYNNENPQQSAFYNQVILNGYFTRLRSQNIARSFDSQYGLGSQSLATKPYTVRVGFGTPLPAGSTKPFSFQQSLAIQIKMEDAPGVSPIYLQLKTQYAAGTDLGSANRRWPADRDNYDMFKNRNIVRAGLGGAAAYNRTYGFVHVYPVRCSENDLDEFAHDWPSPVPGVTVGASSYRALCPVDDDALNALLLATPMVRIAPCPDTFDNDIGPKSAFCSAETPYSNETHTSSYAPIKFLGYDYVPNFRNAYARRTTPAGNMDVFPLESPWPGVPVDPTVPGYNCIDDCVLGLCNRQDNSCRSLQALASFNVDPLEQLKREQWSTLTRYLNDNNIPQCTVPQCTTLPSGCWCFANIAGFWLQRRACVFYCNYRKNMTFFFQILPPQLSVCLRSPSSKNVFAP